MHRDPHLVARNAFVLPGGLLAFYGLLGVAAAVLTQLRSSACAAAGQVYLGGLCWNLLPWAVAVFLVGAALVAFGLVRHRGRPEAFHAMLLPGTGVHFVLVLLGSFVVLPLLAGLVRYLQAGAPGTTPAMTRLGDLEIAQWKLLVLLAVVGLLMFVPALAMYLRQLRLRRAFLGAVEAGDADGAEPAEEPAAPRTAPVDPAAARPKRPPEDRPVPYDVAAAAPPLPSLADGWVPVERVPRATAAEETVDAPGTASAEEALQEAEEATDGEAHADTADAEEAYGAEAAGGPDRPAQEDAAEEPDWFGAGPEPGPDERSDETAEALPEEGPAGPAWGTEGPPGEAGEPPGQEALDGPVWATEDEEMEDEPAEEEPTEDEAAEGPAWMSDQGLDEEPVWMTDEGPDGGEGDAEAPGGAAADEPLDEAADGPMGTAADGPDDAPTEAEWGADAAWASEGAGDPGPAADGPDDAPTAAAPEPDVFAGLSEEERLSLQATLEEAGTRRCHAVTDEGACEAPVAPGRQACVEHTCQAGVEGGDCPEPRSPGRRYCGRHGCQGRTRSGEPCQNLSLAGFLHCAVHRP